jgi:ABC-type uncharacterized transport system auxiliary subunit
MRMIALVACSLLLLAVLSGCGGSGNTTTLNLTPLTEEQKRKLKEEDQRIDEEESPSNRTRKPKGKKN